MPDQFQLSEADTTDVETAAQITSHIHLYVHNYIIVYIFTPVYLNTVVVVFLSSLSP